MRRLLPLLLLLLVPAGLVAGVLTIPHAFSNAAVADATQVNANFTAVRNAVDALENGTAGVWSKSGTNVAYAGGNVGVGTTTPGARLEVNGDFIRTIARWQGYDGDGTDNGGPLVGRRVTFQKRQANTGLRVQWSDNFRVSGAAQACRWEVLFNGVRCTNPGTVGFDQYEGGTGSNRHDLGTVFGTCFGLAAGTVEVTTRVGPTPGYSGADCYTGWNGQLSSFEVEEVR